MTMIKTNATQDMTIMKAVQTLPIAETKIGLVLGGGGGKGAYQIGVWKYLAEVGLDKRVDMVSGTSVGALNGCLFLQGDYALAYNIWTKEINGKILNPDDYSKDTITKNIKGLFSNSLAGLPNATVKLFSGGMFSRDGLLEVIDKFVDLEAVSKDSREIFAACSAVIGSNILDKIVEITKIKNAEDISNIAKQGLPFDPKYFKLNGSNADEMKKILCATSALLVVFKPEKIDGTLYVDGGYVATAPIQASYDTGCTDIIVVYLDKKDIVADKSPFANANIHEIIPSKDLGNLITGVLDFSEEGAIERIELGYADAKNALAGKF